MATALVLGYMCKPMIMSAPVLLLLLDVWPLRRLATPLAAGSSLSSADEPAASGLAKRAVGLLVEKMPLFALCAVGVGWTMYTSAVTGATRSLDQWSLMRRLTTVPITYARYVRKLFWPEPLAIYYPSPAQWPWLSVVVSAVMVVAITVIALRYWRRWPWLLVGWLWFVIQLMPVNGLVIPGAWSTSDRFTYVPYIGLLLVIGWAAYQWADTPGRRRSIAAVGALWLAACAVVTSVQVWHWRDSLSIMGHALAVTTDNAEAEIHYGYALWADGRMRESTPHFARAWKLEPDLMESQVGYARCLVNDGRLDEAAPLALRAAQRYPKETHAWTVLGSVLAGRGQTQQAIASYQRALEQNPRNDEAHRLLAYSLFSAGQIDAGEQHLRAALEINPKLADAHHRLGLLAMQRGSADEAEARFQAALAADPKMGLALLDYGTLLAQQGRMEEALDRFRRAGEALPVEDPASRSRAAFNQARVLQRLQRGDEAAQQIASAIDWAERAVTGTPGDPAVQFQLADTLAATGQADRARAVAAQAHALAVQKNNQYLVRRIEARFPGLKPPATTRASP
jgi:tetratricopeptide (TPR) repeat protein